MEQALVRFGRFERYKGRRPGLEFWVGRKSVEFQLTG
jgi:hypothetical protein